MFFDQHAGGEGFRCVAGQHWNAGLEDRGTFVEAGGDEMDGAAVFGAAIGEDAVMRVEAAICW